jgi:hypothetical protein
LEIGVVLEVVGVYGGDVVWGTSGSGVFLFIGGQITPDVSVLNFVDCCCPVFYGAVC